MSMLKQVQFNEEINLDKVTFNGSEDSLHEKVHVKYFNFNLKSNTSFNFRIVVRISYSIEHEILSLSILGEELIGSHWQASNNSYATPTTGTICQWVLNDFDSIASHFLKEVAREFPNKEFRSENTISPFVNNRIKLLKEKKDTAITI